MMLGISLQFNNACRASSLVCVNHITECCAKIPFLQAVTQTKFLSQ